MAELKQRVEAELKVFNRIKDRQPIPDTEDPITIDIDAYFRAVELIKDLTEQNEKLRAELIEARILLVNYSDNERMKLRIAKFLIQTYDLVAPSTT